MVKKRERLEIIHDMLRVVMLNHGEIKPTRLLYASNLSPQMFKDYTKELVTKGFLTLDEDKKGNKTFILTEKGFSFLEKYKTIIEFVDNFGL